MTILTHRGDAALANNGGGDFLYLAAGAGVQAEEKHLAALANEVARVPIGSWVTTQFPGAYVLLKMTGLFHDGDLPTTGITELGIFDAASGGNLLIYDGEGIADLSWSATWSRVTWGFFIENDSDDPLLSLAGIEAILKGNRSEFAYMAVGTGSQTPSLFQTTLVNELERIAVGASSVAGAEVRLEAYLDTNQAIGSLTEFGLFNAATGGTLLMYGTWPAVAKGQIGLRVLSAILVDTE